MTCWRSSISAGPIGGIGICEPSDRVLGRPDIRHHVQRGTVAVVQQFGDGKSFGCHPIALDPRGRDRFRTNQQVIQVGVVSIRCVHRHGRVRLLHPRRPMRRRCRWAATGRPVRPGRMRDTCHAHDHDGSALRRCRPSRAAQRSTPRQPPDVPTYFYFRQSKVEIAGGRRYRGQRRRLCCSATRR